MSNRPITRIDIDWLIAMATNSYYEFYFRQGQLNLRSIPAA